ncbi:MAG TPA: ATP-binding protein [Bryobacteraceae bacterium]|nr:ATP-binding protein [Bryobacteraceae bacterium]
MKSVRLRLSAWYTLALLVCLGLFGLVTWMAVSSSVTRGIDQGLDRRMEAVRLFLEYAAASVPPSELPEELREFAMGLPEGNLLEVRDANGTVLLPAAQPFRQSRDVMTRRQTLEVRGHRYQATAAASLGERGYILSHFGILLLAAIPFAVAIAVCGGLWMGRIIERLNNSVERLTQFTADASHELRSPIALIRTTAEIALRQNRSAESYREALEQIRDESERTTHLVEDLLALARADAGATKLQLVPVDLSALVADTCEQQRRQVAAKDLRFETELPADNVLVHGNDPAIRRLIQVLLDNAVKYTPPGGLVRVSVASKADRVELSVRDTGIGIAEEDLPKVFDRFYRADKARSRDEGGSGLGLSIAQWIARCHGAEIQAESSAGVGSVFRIAFKT